MNRKISILAVAAFVLTLGACGARDDKNETENYPTYDTTQKVNTINDSGDADQYGSGSLRHNIDDKNDKQE